MGEVHDETKAFEKFRMLLLTFFFFRSVQLILVTFVMQLGKKPQKDFWYV